MDEDDWQEQSIQQQGAEDGPVVAVCYFDSSEELRGRVEENWLELQAGFGDDGIAELSGVPWRAANLGVRVHIDDGMELSLSFYPILHGVPREDLGEGADQPLLQLHDDGRGGPDAARLKALVEWLLEDFLPYLGHFDADVIEDRFGGGERGLVLTSTTGQLLELPPDLSGGIVGH